MARNNLDCVSMPVRAFLDSDRSAIRKEFCPNCEFQCPSGHFLIQTSSFKILCGSRYYRFNARQGIS